MTGAQDGEQDGERAWWRSAVVYQVWPRSFSDGDGDGVGDLRGVLSRLDHLADLGVDVLWLSPVYPSPGVDGGYDISDYRAVDPLFGDLADLDGLIAALHARGMRLVLDVVLNHTSDRHPWFVESRADRDNPRRDWYFWRPEPVVPRGGEPWTSLFGGPAWTLDETTGEHYLHSFAVEQPDLDWDNPAVRAAVFATLRWWLARGVDGFRLDVISMVSKDLTGPSPLGPGPRLHEHLQELHREVLGGRDPVVVTAGEMPGISVEDAVLATDPARAELDMVIQFEHVSVDQGDSKWDARPLSLPRLKESFARWQRGLAAAGWNALYLSNHDQPRPVSRFGDVAHHRTASATALATVLHLHRGTPFVYQGEELGMADAGFTSLSDYRDVESLDHYAEAVAAGQSPADALAALARTGRDNARTPVQWDATEHAGFTTGTPWIAVNPDHVTVNAAAQRDDPHSVLAHYRRLIALRHDEPAVVHGDFTLLLPDDEQVWAFTRRHGGTELLVLANCSPAPATARLEVDPAWAGAELLLGNLHDSAAGLQLRPWEALVLRRGG